ncbi:MAG TPA: hypothetical protein VHY79_01550 [Rhizomicrobium sp.]|jgi:hypothetical protein|nr:hypothetical protein [Rhizomicrobium sp.]
MLQKIEHARREALAAYRTASESLDTRLREDWLRVAALWEQLAAEYQRLLATSPGSPVDSPE